MVTDGSACAAVSRGDVMVRPAAAALVGSDDVDVAVEAPAAAEPAGAALAESACRASEFPQAEVRTASSTTPAIARARMLHTWG